MARCLALDRRRQYTGLTDRARDMVHKTHVVWSAQESQTRQMTGMIRKKICISVDADHPTHTKHISRSRHNRRRRRPFRNTRLGPLNLARHEQIPLISRNRRDIRRRQRCLGAPFTLFR